MPETYHLSVIIASYNSGETIEDCLKSLENQATDKAFEVIVIDSSADTTAKRIEERFPNVNLFAFRERKYCGDARNFGISVAKGNIIAFLDADCTADKNWVNEIIDAHQTPYPAIGGAIANGNPDSYVGWAAYFSEFSRWMPSRCPQWLSDIAGSNMSYKRDTFKRFGSFIGGTYCSDTEYHWRLRRDGYRLRFMPSILIFHHNIDRFNRFIAHEYHHGCSFSMVRTRSQRISLPKRILYVIFSPLIIGKLFCMIALMNLRNRIYLIHFLKALPLVILGLISWTFGECVGYVRG